MNIRPDAESRLPLLPPFALLIVAGFLISTPSLHAYIGDGYSRMAMADDDMDGVVNAADNCVLIANVDQRDSNGDGYGNICDADFNNDGIVNGVDLGLFRLSFFQAGNLDADLNGDMVVNATDLGLLRQRFFLPPGPSGFIPLIDVSATIVSFDEVLVGADTTASFEIANSGYTPLTIYSISVNGTAFSVFPPTSFTMDAGDPPRTIELGFAPDVIGAVSNTVTVQSNAGLDPTIHINVNGLGRDPNPQEFPDISVTGSIEFGTVAELGSATRAFTVQNVGSAPLTITALTPSDSSVNAWPLIGNLPLLVNSGDTRTIRVTVQPPAGSAGTTLSKTLTIVSNDPDQANKAVALFASVITAAPPVDIPIVAARIDGNSIDNGNCALVSGSVSFSAAALSSDTLRVTLKDQGGNEVSSASVPSLDGAGSVPITITNACSLLDGVIEIRAILTRPSRADLPGYLGSLAVKNTSPLAPPVLDPLEPVSLLPITQVCGTSRADTTVKIAGGTSVVSATLDALTTTFCLDVVLRPNTQNTLIVSAIDDLAVAPRPISMAPPVQVVQVTASDIVIAEATSEPLTEEEIAELVENGIIDLDDPSNFNVSIFTIVFTIGSFPVTVSEPVAVPITPGTGGIIIAGWAPPPPVGQGGPPGGVPCQTGCTTITITPTGVPGQVIPGVIIIDGRIKTLRELYQVTLAILNASSSFNLTDINSTLELPGGLTAIAVGPGTDVGNVNVDGEITSLSLGSLAPGETGTGQFIIRGDSIGTYAVDVGYDGFITDGGIPVPVPFSGQVGTTVEVLGPPELGVVVRHPSDPSGPDVSTNQIYSLIIEITNLSSQPALYTSLDLFVGGDALLVDENHDPLPEGNDIRDFGNIPPGATVSATFLVESLAQGEIIACQAVASENISLTIDTGPDGTDCNIANTIPADFQPLPVDAPPTVFGINPLNGQPNNPVTTSVFATLTPESGCLIPDTWTNVVTQPIGGNPANGFEIISANLATTGSFYLEELDIFGSPVAHIPTDLTVVSPPAGGTTIATLRLGLDSPQSQVFLKSNTRYRATLVGADLDPTNAVCNASSLVKMASTFRWTFNTSQNCAASTAPTVTMLQPSNGAIDRPLNQDIVLQFSNRMDLTTFGLDPFSIPNSSFGIYQDAVEAGGELTGGSPVPGAAAFTNLGRSLTFSPQLNFGEDATIHVRLTDAVIDECGNPLATPPVGVKLFSFQTAPPDAIAPNQPLLNPLPVLTGNRTLLVSGSAEPDSTVTITGGATAASKRVSPAGLFAASVALTGDQSNVLAVDATDASGNTSTPVVTNDINGDPLVVFYDATPPNVLTVTPPAGSINVPRNSAVSVVLNEPLRPGTINTLNVVLRSNAGNAPGTLQLNGDSGFTFVPLALLQYGAEYTLRIRANGVSDLAGNGLAIDATSRFTVEPPPPPVLNTLLPDSGVQNTSFQVTFTGTNLLTSNAIISDNPGVSGSIASATDDTVIANISIDTIAAAGVTTLGVMTNGGSASVPFTVIQKPPVISALVPATGVAGTTVPAQIQGSGLSSITSLTISGSGVTLNDLGTGDDTLHDVEFVVAVGAATGPRTVTLTTSGGLDTTTFNVVMPIITIAPANTIMLTRASTDLSVNLSAPAGPGGQTIALAAPGSVISLPVSVIVPQGLSSADFTITTSGESGATTITATATGFADASSNITVQQRGLSLTVPLVGLSQTVQASINLSQPAPVGGATILLSSDNVTLATVNPASVLIPEGGTSASFDVIGGSAIGTATITADGTADGFASDDRQISVTNRQIDLPSTLELALNDTVDIQVAIGPDPAEPGGLPVDVVSSDSGIVSIVTPLVTIPAGTFAAQATIQALAPGQVTITGSNAGFLSDSSIVNVTTNTSFLQPTLTIDDVETGNVYFKIESGGNLFYTPTPVDFTLSSDDSNCVSVDATATVAIDEFFATAPVNYAGVATLPCTATVTASNPIFGTATVDVTIDSTPPNLGSIGVSYWQSSADQRVGAGLQALYYVTLADANHGGVTVLIESSDPSVLRLATDATTPGTPVITLFVPDGNLTAGPFYGQGVTGTTGLVTLTASESQFSDGTLDLEVVTPVLALDGTLVATTTSLSPDDPFTVRGYTLNTAGTALLRNQQISAGAGTLSVTLTSSDPLVGQLVTSAVPGGAGSLTVDIAAGATASPTSVAAGGVAFDPLTGGSTDIVASASGFGSFSSATRTVNVSQPAITVSYWQGSADQRLGAGLQAQYYVILGGGEHGGVTLRVTSSDPAKLTLSTDPLTPGTGFIDMFVADGVTQVGPFYGQGVTGTTGLVTLTASESQFSDGTLDLEVVTPVLALDGTLAATTTSLSPDDPFTVRGYTLNTAGTALLRNQQISAGAGTLSVTLTSSDPLVGQLVTSAVPGGAGSLTVDIAAGATASPTSVAAGGVAFDPLTGGSTDIVASASGFGSFSSATRTVNVSQPAITVSYWQGSADQRLGAGLQAQYYVILGGGEHGGVTLRVTSSDPAKLTLSTDPLTPGTGFIDMFVADGVTQVGPFYGQGVTGTTGLVTLTASESQFSDGTLDLEVVTPVLALDGTLAATTTSLSPDDPFTVRGYTLNTAGTALLRNQQISAGAGTLSVTLTSSDPLVGQLVTSAVPGGAGSLTVDIAAGATASPTSVAAGGVAFDPLTGGSTDIVASASGFGSFSSATRTVNVSQPAITVSYWQGSADQRLGAGLQAQYYVILGGGEHGGVTLRVTSSDPAKLTLSTDPLTPGTGFIDMFVADGVTQVGPFYGQGVTGTTGLVTLTASESQFSDGTLDLEVVTPVLALDGTLAATTTSLSPDDPFTVRGYTLNTAGTALLRNQQISAGAGTLSVTLTSSDPLVGQLVTSAVPGGAGSLTVDIAAGATASPTSVAAGGVAFDPLTGGSTDIVASASGFGSFSSATRTVNVSQPAITLSYWQGSADQRLGAGLQAQYYVILGGGEHGGVTLRVTSSDPAKLTLSTDPLTPGTGFIDIFVADGVTQVGPFYGQGVTGTTGLVTLTASESQFSDGTLDLEVVTPVLALDGTLAATTTSLSPDDPFTVRGYTLNTAGTALLRNQQISAGAGTLSVTLTSSDPLVGQLVTSAVPGGAGSLTVDIAAGATASPTSVAAGGVAFDPLTGGSTDIVASASGFASFSSDTRSVTVTE